MKGGRIVLPIMAHDTVDGDSIHVTVGLNLPVRLSRIDTPELSVSEQAEAAKVARKCSDSWIHWHLLAGNRLELHAAGIGLFGRIEGDVCVDEEDVNEAGLQAVIELGVSLRQYLLDQGVAVETDGTRRHDWTKAELHKIEAKASEE